MPCFFKEDCTNREEGCAVLTNLGHDKPSCYNKEIKSPETPQADVPLNDSLVFRKQFDKVKSACPSREMTYAGEYYCKGQFMKECSYENCLVKKLVNMAKEEH